MLAAMSNCPQSSSTAVTQSGQAGVLFQQRMPMLHALPVALIFALLIPHVAACDITSCELRGESETRTLHCDVQALLAQNTSDRVLVAATMDPAHPVQTYLLQPSPFPSTYVPLTNEAAAAATGLKPSPHLDYCYRVHRSKGYDTDLMGIVQHADCAEAGAINAKAFVLNFNNAFISLHGNVYINSLHVYSCGAHVLFGGCNENMPLESHMLSDSAVVVDKAVAIMTRWGSSYYHWVIEELPRLAYVIEMLLANPDIRIITHDHVGNRLFFEFLGLDPKRVVPVQGNTVFFVRELAVPPVAHCGRPALTASHKYRERLRRGMAERGLISGHDAAGKHIVVIQRDGPRHTTNHGELMTALRSTFPRETFVEFGPHFVPANDTAAIFGNAKGVVGVHGAGFSNIVFSPSSAFIVEFHPRESNQNTHPNICHQGSAAGFGMEHVLVWLPDGQFNGGVSIPVQQAIQHLCKLIGSQDELCGK
eukprot:m.248432 g.248432  ORF g.248432 m.248432 type:complete len:478 (+) comp15727_c0_seq1:196-1629(+)